MTEPSTAEERAASALATLVADRTGKQVVQVRVKLEDNKSETFSIATEEDRQTFRQKRAEERRAAFAQKEQES